MQWVSRLERDRELQRLNGLANAFAAHAPLPAQLVSPRPWRWHIGGVEDIRQKRGNKEHEAKLMQFDILADCMGSHLARGFSESCTVSAPVYSLVCTPPPPQRDDPRQYKTEQ